MKENSHARQYFITLAISFIVGFGVVYLTVQYLGNKDRPDDTPQSNSDVSDTSNSSEIIPRGGELFQ